MKQNPDKITQRLRILLVPSAYYPNFGGVEEICRNLASVLKQDCEVAIAVNRYPSNLGEKEIIEGTTVLRFDFYYPNRSWSGLRGLGRMVRTTASFTKFLKSWAPDIVHVICPSTSAFYLWAARNTTHFKLLVTFQGELFMDAHGLYERSIFANRCLQLLLDKADAITACSQFVMSDALAKFRVPTRSRDVIFNGVDLQLDVFENQLLASKIRAGSVLGVGRLVHNKGFDVLIQAVAAASNRVPSIQLNIVGDGPERSALETLTERLGVENCVQFLGRLNPTEVQTVFQKCGLFVLPSPLEPFGIVCLEAMRAGKPVIATNAGGPPEFVRQGETGLLVTPTNALELADAIERLLEDPTEMNRLGANARTEVTKFDWRVIAQQYFAIYQKLAY